MASLPPVIATLLADTKQYSAEMAKAQGQMDTLGKSSTAAGGKFSAFASKAATAVVAVGAAIGIYAVDKAYKFQEALDAIARQSGASTAGVQRLGAAILNISTQTGVATTDLTQAGLAIEQAGYRGAAAQTLLTDAAKAAVITNASAADTVHALIAAETLQIAKGMDVTKLTGVLVAGAKDFTGGLQAEEKMLSGRVGVALANYGLHLKDIISLGAEMTKVGLPTRSIVSFTTGLANLEKPLTSATGKFTTYAKTLARLGLNQQDLATLLRRGNLVGLLTQINDAAVRGGGPLSQYVNAVFGASGGAAASVLIKNLSTIKDIQTNIAGAGAGSLAGSFKSAIQQIGPQLHILMAQVDVLMIRAAKLLLPALTDVVKWANDFFGVLKKSAVLREVFGVTLATLFAGAVAVKLTALIRSIIGLFGVSGAASAAGGVGAGELAG